MLILWFPRVDNIDYNSLKHHIKVHTTKDQATAITIPGHQDAALRNFEDGLYEELCRQHDRVDLFVSSKADEIARRLRRSLPGHVNSTQLTPCHRTLVIPDPPPAHSLRFVAAGTHVVETAAALCQAREQPAAVPRRHPIPAAVCGRTGRGLPKDPQEVQEVDRVFDARVSLQGDGPLASQKFHEARLFATPGRA
jgi:hypothetical protein